MSNNIHSNAFNFDGAASSGVDPRTGQYYCQIDLITIKPVNMDHEGVSLSISYDPFASITPFLSDFSSCWILNTSTIEITNNDQNRPRKISLSNGMSFEFANNPNNSQDALLRDNKVHNVRVRRVSATRFEVWYKNGMIEILDLFHLRNRTMNYRCTAILFPNGESFTLVWSNSHIDRITHETVGTIFEIASRDSLSQVTSYRFRTATNATATVHLEYNRNSLLTSVSLPFLSHLVMPTNLPRHRFDYEQRNNRISITRYTNPLGSVETMEYRDTVQITNRISLPAVSDYWTIPSGPNSVSIYKRYTYSSNNFMGYDPSNPQFVEGTDNLYLRTTPYKYTSTERILNLSLIALETTTRTYNRFHLLVSEVTTRGDCRTTHLLEYNEFPNTNFFGQPGNLQFPRRSQMIYRDMSTGRERTETESMETDRYGNVLSNTDAAGITKRYTYYPAGGTSGQCPADPLGFSRFLREVRVSPASGITPVAPDKVITYTYERFNGIRGRSFIAKATERVNAQAESRLSYITAPDSGAGLILSEVYTLNRQTTRKNYTYGTINEGRRTTTVTTRGFDNVSSTEISIDHVLTGNQLSFTDVTGVRKTFEYHPWGHMTSETLHINANDRIIRRFNLIFNGETFTEETIEPTGHIKQEIYDGLGRLIQERKRPNASASWINSREISYNQLSQEVREVQFIRFRDSGSASERIVSKTTNYSYDGWGNRRSTNPSSGTRIDETHSKIDNTVLVNIWGRGSRRAHLNRFGEEDRVVMLHRNGNVYSEERAAYDGFGRIISETDPEGNTTRYEYDVFDRVITKIQPGDIRVTMSYASFSHENYIESISVNNTRFGSLQYDGLGRVIRSTVGGRVTQFGYSAGASKPNRITAPNGSVQNITYNRFLKDTITQIQTAGLTDHTFSHNNTLSTMTSARNQSQVNTYTYDANQNLSREETNASGFLRNARYEHSSISMLSSITDYHGNTESYFYGPSDPRLIRMTKGRVTTTFTYDGTTENLSGILSVDAATNVRMNTQIVYDDFLRETTRTFISNQGTQTMTCSYNRNHQMTRRVTREAGQVLRDEFFEYDNNSRLTMYHTQGGLRPTDHTNRIFYRQVFTYDLWGNIATLVTAYNGGIFETTTYTYGTTDPTQLISIARGTTAAITLQYDANGRLTRDEQGRQLIYNNLDQLIRVNNPDGSPLCTYSYDALGNLIEQLVNGVRNRRFYTLGELSNMDNGTNLIAYINGAEQRAGQTSSATGTTLFGNDLQDTVLSGQAANNQTNFAYAAYGYRHQASILPGFTGAIVDPVTGWYFLGNGYRVYNPILMRFHTPDSWSPFGAGGINPYAYTNGDPINNSDPSGHMSTGDIISLTITVVSLALTLAGGVGIVLKGVAAVGRLFARLFRIGRRARSMAKVVSKAARSVARPKVTAGSAVKNTISVMSDTLAIANIVIDNENVNRVLTYAEAIFAGVTGAGKGIVNLSIRSLGSRTRTAIGTGAKGTINKYQKAKRIAGNTLDIYEGLSHAEAFTMSVLSDYGMFEKNADIELSQEIIEYTRAGGKAGSLGINFDINFAVDPGNSTPRFQRNSLSQGRVPITSRRIKTTRL